MLLRLLRFVVLAATVASGLVLVVKPESASGFTGLAPDAARGEPHVLPDPEEELSTGVAKSQLDVLESEKRALGQGE